MKTATAKIKEVVRTKDHTNSFGTTTYHDLIMDNGDKISIGKKALQKVGWELSYQVVDEQSGEFHKSKSIKPEEVVGFVAQTNTNSSSHSGSLNVQNMIVAQNSVTNAVNYCKDSMSKSPENVLEVAELFYKWVLNKG